MRLNGNLVLIAILAFGASAQSQDSLSAILTLEKALSLALKSNPELAAVSQELKAREAEVLQAKLPSNPELEVEAENLAARGHYRRNEDQEITARISQVFEWGTWGPRIRLANAEKEITRLEFESRKLDVLTEVGKAYVEASAARERLKLSQDLLAMAEQARNAAEARAQAGKASPLDALKSRATLSMVRADLNRAEAEGKVALKKLAKACGVASLDSIYVEGNLETISAIPEWRSIENRLAENPDMARWAQERERQEAALRLEKGSRLPPLTLGAGVRQGPDLEGHAYTAELKFSLPAWNWNQGAVRAARHRQQRTLEEQKAVSLDLSSRLFEAHSRLAVSHREVELFKVDVLPVAQGAYEAAEEGYRSGKFGNLEVLDARRTLSEARSRYLDALMEYHLSSLDMQRLLGANALSPHSNPQSPIKGDHP